MLTITSMVQAIEGKEDKLEKHLMEFSKKVKTEKGTLIYVIHRIRNQKGKFLFYEKFTDDNAFHYHNNTIHMQELVKKIGNLISDEPVLTYLEEISSEAETVEGTAIKETPLEDTH